MLRKCKKEAWQDRRVALLCFFFRNANLKSVSRSLVGEGLRSLSPAPGRQILADRDFFSHSYVSDPTE